MTDYPLPSRSFKSVFPFRIGTTSFIYPDHYLPNVRMLGPYVDEIELLMFESVWPDSLPSDELISGLIQVGKEFGLSFNIHLPTDVSLTDPDPDKRKKAVDIIRIFIEKTRPLSPSAFTLHLPCEQEMNNSEEIRNWRKRASLSLSALKDAGISGPMLAVETLDYPIERAEELIREFDLSLCMDMGHLFLYGYDVKRIWEKYAERIPLIHLHGVRDGKDHLALTALSPEHADTVRKILGTYTGVVSLEVFSYQTLLPSLDILENIFS